MAALTAGLHFTESVLNELAEQGVGRVFVTLHVGMGTFKPVTADSLADHVMHSERYAIDAVAVEGIESGVRERQANHRGRHDGALGCWKVGRSDQPWRETNGDTSIFIYPPYRWKRVGALITNFHLPKSTLIALVAAFVGLDEQRRLYRTAIEQKYRFFSYGDAMFLE